MFVIKISWFGFPQGLTAQDRLVQRRCWLHRVRNGDPGGENQQRSERGIQNAFKNSLWCQYQIKIFKMICHYFCHNRPAPVWYIFVPTHLLETKCWPAPRVLHFSASCDFRQPWVQGSPTRSRLTPSPWPAYPPIRQWPQVWRGENSLTHWILGG